MKHFLTVFALVSCVACTKSVSSLPGDQPLQTRISNSAPDTSALVADLGGTILTITMTPDLICYSTENGEDARPCNIVVNVNCTLSNPINKSIMVRLKRNNVDANAVSNTPDPKQPTTSAGQNGPQSFAFTLAPGTTTVTLASPFTNENNVSIPDGRFSIAAVSAFTMVN